MANLGSSLASYFSVFHRLLTNRLKQVPQADAALLQSLAAELKVEHLSILSGLQPIDSRVAYCSASFCVLSLAHSSKARPVWFLRGLKFTLRGTFA